MNNDFTYGYHLLGKRANSTAINNAGQAGIFSGKDPIEFNSAQPITLFIIQLVIIIVFTQGLGFLFKYIRQPRVIAEVIGGIILGPTVMGRIPNFTNNIFPAPSMPFLNLVATIGLVLFLFVVGMEVDVAVIRKNWKATVAISTAGLILPFGTGAALAVGIYRQFITDEVDFGHFLLFVGTAISITAFPVLCRILSETKLLTTRVGQIVLSAGVGNDVIGWILLALTIALVNADTGASAAYILICSIAWTIFILWPVRIAFRWLCRRSGCFDGDNGPTPFVMVVMLMLVFISSFMTDIIGVHPIFGGFIVGIIIPHEHSFAQRVTDKLEDLVSVLFLPIYFVLSGLKTNLGLLDNGITWGYSIAIILVAFFGKFLGCAIAAYAMKFSKRESLAVGTLMSCKGLVELIVLNVGLAAGILDARVFSMFVLMAIVNTVVTTPLTLWVYPAKYRVEDKAHARRGSVSSGSGAVMGGGSGGSPTIVSRFFVVVSKLEHLGTAMLFTQLFGQTGGVSQAIPAAPPTHASDDKSITKEVDTGSEIGSDAHNTAHFPTDAGAPVEAQRWVAQKLVELTGRTHSVMQSIEAETAATKDDMLQIYKSFAGLRGLNLKTRMDVVDHESFPEVVVNRARDAGSDLVVIPWTTPASGPTAAVLNERRGSGSEDDQIAPKSPNPFDHVFGAEKSDLYTFFLRRVFAESGKNIAVLVDRGFSAGKTMSAGIGGQHVFVPFFGGADDRLALSLAVQLCHQSNITATVIRFNQISDITKPEPTERKRTISSVSMQENIKAHEKALEINHLTVKKTPARIEAMNSSAADAEAWSNLVDSASSLKHPPALRSAISRIHFQTVPTSEPISTLIELVNDAVKQHQDTSWRPLLALVGRGRLGSSEGNVDGREIARILVNEGHAPDVGAEIRKTIGDVATVLAVTSKASVMVVQSGGEVREEAA